MTFVLPAAFLAIEHLVSPHADDVEPLTRQWAQALGLEADPHTTKRLDDVGLGWYTGLFWPQASLERLSICADLMTWFFVEDDYCDEGPHFNEPEPLEAALGEIHTHVFRSPVAAPSPLATGLADIYRRAGRGMSTEWHRRHARHFADHFDAMTRAAAFRQGYQQGREPHRSDEPDGFLALWRDSHAFLAELDLIEVVAGAALPATIYYSPVYQTLIRLSMNLICGVNDLVSIAKEQESTDVFNLVPHYRRLHNCTRAEAFERGRAEIENWTAQFIVAQTRLPDTLSQLGVSDDTRTHALECAAGLRAAFRGNADWTLHTARYILSSQ